MIQWGVHITCLPSHFDGEILVGVIFSCMLVSIQAWHFHVAMDSFKHVSLARFFLIWQYQNTCHAKQKQKLETCKRNAMP